MVIRRRLPEPRKISKTRGLQVAEPATWMITDET
ncbi:MAG: hypothetical protein RL701_135, partial [Pseudomonadota bacterium]